MEYYIRTLIAATFGTLGFGMLFKIKPSALAVCSLGGMLTWSVFLVADYLNCGIFTSNLFASIFAIIFSSCVAIKLKIPSTVLLTPCVVPLVPGGGLYYTMQSLIWKDYDKFYEHGSNAMLTAVGIAGGIVIGSILFSAFRKPFPKISSINKSKYRGQIYTNNEFNPKVHQMHLFKEPFESIVKGNKRIELRLYDDKRKQIKENDIIEFICNESSAKDNKLHVKVLETQVYPTFKELYENESLYDIGYTNENIENATHEDMEKYYTLEMQKRYSVIAIKFSIL